MLINIFSKVEHFDQQREAQARKSKFLHRIINSKKEELAGGLTGKPQSWNIQPTIAN
jgi:hypothetical protein